MADYISKKRLYLDAEGKVTDDDNKGVSLLVGENGTLDEAEAKKYGLSSSGDSENVTKTDDKEKSQSEEVESDDKSGLVIDIPPVVEDKAIPQPNQPKKRGRPSKKGGK